MTTRPTAAVVAALWLLTGCSTAPTAAPTPAPHEATECAACPDEATPDRQAQPVVDAPPGLPAGDARVQGVVGQHVADLSSDWLQGEAEVGERQLVVFFETWCPHCRREVPRLQALHDDLGAEGLSVVGLTSLSRGVDAPQLLAFAEEHALTYPIERAPGPLKEQLQITGVPAAVLLQDGEVVWRGHPGRLDRATLRGWIDADPS